MGSGSRKDFSSRKDVVYKHIIRSMKSFYIQKLLTSFPNLQFKKKKLVKTYNAEIESMCSNIFTD